MSLFAGRTPKRAASKGRRGEFARMACKPDSVLPLRGGMTIPLGPPLPTGSSCQPGPLGLKRPCRDIPGGISRREAPIRHCSRWGLPCRSGCPSRGGLLPHRFTLTRTCRADCSLWRFPSGCPGRALPGTVASWSPDFPRVRRPAAIRPSAQGSPKGSRPGGQRASRASPAASARSSSSSGPVAQGRNLRRSAARRRSSATSG